MGLGYMTFWVFDLWDMFRGVSRGRRTACDCIVITHWHRHCDQLLLWRRQCSESQTAKAWKNATCLFRTARALHWIQ